MQERIIRLLQEWNLDPWAWNGIILAVAIIIGLLIQGLLWLLVRKRAEEGDFSFFQSILRHLGRPVSFFLPLFVLNLLLPVMRLPADIRNRIGHILEIGLIIGFAWILIRTISVVQDYIFHRFDLKKADNLRERKIRTQLQFLRRLIMAVIILLTIAAVLLTFETMRKIGTGLLTGVGIGGIIIGFAAQRSLGNLLAGFQIAFTQPMRIDDAVIVEGEFGNVEEITLTYVVVRIWDDRRLILPINYFIEKPFQNWTRTSSALLGTVFFYTDYTMPLEPLRAELDRLLKSNKLWDGRAKGLVVTDIKERTAELRVLVSARNSGELFDLRCYVREHLMKFILENFSDHLPQQRVINKLEVSPEIQRNTTGMTIGDRQS